MNKYILSIISVLLGLVITAQQSFAQTEGPDTEATVSYEYNDEADENEPVSLPPITPDDESAVETSVSTVNPPSGSEMPPPPPDVNTNSVPAPVDPAAPTMTPNNGSGNNLPIDPPQGRRGGRPSRDSEPENVNFSGFGNMERNRLEETVGNIILVDETPTQVLALIEQLTGKVIIPMQNLPVAKININTSRGSSLPLTRAEALIYLKSALAIHGIALSPISGRLLKAYPQVMANSQSPELIVGRANDMVGSQEVYTKLFRLDYLTADEARIMIEKLQSIPTLIIFTKTNSLLITDSLTNLQRIETLLDQSDIKPELQTKVIYFKLDKTTPSEIKARLTALQQGQLGRILVNTTFEADDRSSKLIVITHPSNEQQIRELIEELDVDVSALTTSEVINIDYAEAKEVVAVLDQIIQTNNAATSAAQLSANRQQGGQQQNQQQRGQQQQQQRNQQQQQQNAAANTGNSIVAFQFSSYVKLVADERTNKIIVYGTNNDIQNIKHLLKGIDALLPQVRIEVIIAEVTLGKDRVSGLSAFGMAFNRDGTVIGGNEITGHATGFASTNVGSPFEIVGSLRDFSLDFIVRTAKQNSDVRLLSSPNITTTHNKEATFKVTEQRPVVTGTMTDTSNVGSRSSTVQYRDIGIVLTVTPRIGSDGMIQMDIKQTVDRVIGTTTIDENEQPIIGNREAESYVSVSDKEVIVLAGLRQTNQSLKRSSLAFLGDIPVLGYLFGGRAQEDTTTELIIFIKPHALLTKGHISEDYQNFIDRSPTKEMIRRFGEGEQQEELVVEKPGA